MKNYSENRYQRFSELEDCFLRRYYCYGNFDVLGQVLGRDASSLRKYCVRHGIKYSHEKSKTYSELKAIWDEANRRVNSPIERDLPHEAVACKAPEREERKPELPKQEKPMVAPEQNKKPDICPCHTDEMIVVKRVSLIGGSELFICGRCGRQLALHTK